MSASLSFHTHTLPAWSLSSDEHTNMTLNGEKLLVDTQVQVVATECWTGLHSITVVELRIKLFCNIQNYDPDDRVLYDHCKTNFSGSNFISVINRLSV
jgi:hypothetical protein